MTWIKSKLTRWTANGFTITEDADREGYPFRLESVDADPEWFSSLGAAKAIAAIKNELELVKADNARLRAELDQRKGVWPAGPVAIFDKDDVPQFGPLDFGAALEAGIPREERNERDHP